MREPLVSIIIPTKNGERYLDEVLSQIFGQRCDFAFEVIAIDSESTDRTLDILSQYPVQVKQIPAEQFNHGETRNLGAQLARGDFVVYLTQDATPANDQWLQHLIVPFRIDTDIVAVCSRQMPRKECHPVIAVALELSYPLAAAEQKIKRLPRAMQDPAQMERLVNFSNVSSGYRRETLLGHPFPKTDFAEDAVWEFSILRDGFATMFQPQSVVFHSHDYPLLVWLRRSYIHAWAMGKIFPSSTGRSRNSPPHRSSIFAVIANDRLNLRRRNISRLQRWRGLGYGILWHSAMRIGVLLGTRAEKNPAFLHRFLANGQQLWGMQTESRRP